MAKSKQPSEVELPPIKKSAEFVYAIGRRRGAAARVRVYTTVKDGISWGDNTLKKGSILVNQKEAAEYFNRAVSKVLYEEPLHLTNTHGAYGIMVKVTGGGQNGQLGAMILGISRALALIDVKHRPALKRKGLLKVDSRVKERRKVGTGGKARRKKQSPKR